MGFNHIRFQRNGMQVAGLGFKHSAVPLAICLEKTSASAAEEGTEVPTREWAWLGLFLCLRDLIALTHPLGASPTLTQTSFFRAVCNCGS